MARYGKHKYGVGKYGKYELRIDTDLPLSQIVRYRLRTVGPSGESRAITNMMVNLTSSGPVKVRMRTDTGEWVTNDTATIQGEVIRARIRAGADGQWVESVVGTIRNL